MIKNNLNDKISFDLLIEQRQTEIVDLVHLLLKKKNLNQKKLAERMQKEASYVSRVLSGDVNLTFKTLLELEAALETKLLLTDLNTGTSFQNNRVGSQLTSPPDHPFKGTAFTEPAIEPVFFYSTFFNFV